MVAAGLFGAHAQSGRGGEADIYGFGAAGLRAQRQLESRFLDLPSPARAAEHHEFLTREPHVAGSPRDRELAEWMRDRWREYGLDEVEIVEHRVLLPYPEEVSVEMTAPAPWRASLREDPVDGDPATTRTDLGIPHHAYSASGDVTAPVVYAASGNPDDYDWLAGRGIDVRGKIVLVRYSVPYSYRGFKALTAQERGAAGILIYSDPAEDGFKKGAVYPDGPWGPASHIQRGAIVFDFLVPGDPLTPGWASVDGARRIPVEKAVSLPRIVSAPLSHRDAEHILRALEGPEAPERWQGGLPLTYRVGPGPVVVRLRVGMDDAIRPVWTVVGRVRGREEPRRVVVVGNHRDAWIFGGVDGSSGTAAQMELARALGALARGGVRPRRSIVLASWDAEEFTLTSSTEWGEQHEGELRDHAVAYLNVDSAASGPNLTASAVPALNRLVVEAARDVPDPAASTPLLAVWRERVARERGVPAAGVGDSMVENRLGSGSDYTVFLNFLGVPIVDLAFDGPYGVYHSIYDNHQWVSRFGDPGFRYHAAMARLWGVMALRLANADIVPLDYRPYAARISTFLDELERASPRPDRTARAIGSVREAVARFRSAAEQAAAGIDAALAGSLEAGVVAAFNERLLGTERAFLDPDGIPGRPWYRHLIYAPKYTYAPEPLPGLAEALAARDDRRLAAQAARLAAALDRAASTLAPPDQDNAVKR